MSMTLTLIGQNRRPCGCSMFLILSDRSSEMGDATHYHHSAERHTDISLHNSHDLIRYGFKALREAEYAAGRS
jgi:hypothetical protein